MNNTDNQVQIYGKITKVYPLKETLTGLFISSFILEHISRQFEMLQEVAVRCRLYCIMFSATKQEDNSLFDRFVRLYGFLANNANTQLVLHVQKIDFLEKE